LWPRSIVPKGRTAEAEALSTWRVSSEEPPSTILTMTGVEAPLQPDWTVLGSMASL
jgi:hypothetical protein